MAWTEAGGSRVTGGGSARRALGSMEVAQRRGASSGRGEEKGGERVRVRRVHEGRVTRVHREKLNERVVCAHERVQQFDGG